MFKLVGRRAIGVGNVGRTPGQATYTLYNPSTNRLSFRTVRYPTSKGFGVSKGNSRGQVPLPLILDVGLSQPNAYLTEGDRDYTHLANDGFVSVSFRSDRPFAVKKFQTFLQDKMPADVFRAKGILWFKESPRRHIFQLSGKRYDLKDEDWQGKPSNQLVLIGRSLNELQLHQQLNNCLTR